MTYEDPTRGKCLKQLYKLSIEKQFQHYRLNEDEGEGDAKPGRSHSPVRRNRKIQLKPICVITVIYTSQRGNCFVQLGIVDRA